MVSLYFTKQSLLARDIIGAYAEVTGHTYCVDRENLSLPDSQTSSDTHFLPRKEGLDYL